MNSGVAKTIPSLTPRQRRKRRRLAWRRWTHRVRYTLLLGAIVILQRVIGWLPLRAALALGRKMGRVAGWVCGGYRRIAETQMAQAGVGFDEADRRRLARRMFENFGMSALEWLHSKTWSDEQFGENIVFERSEVVDRLRAQGRGMIMLAPHMGNWELFPRAYLHRFPGQGIVVMAPMKDRRLQAWVIGMRERGGGRVLTTDEGALPMLRILRRGGVLALLGDQDSRRARGIFVEFFGRPAYTPIGPAVLARKGRVPIVPISIQRDPADPRRHLIRMGDPVEADLSEPDEARDWARMTQDYTLQLEAHIRARPEEWVWLHERWRHQPGDRVDLRRKRLQPQ